MIEPSLDEITANTDIDLTYENVKRGRSVVGFKFTVREKPKPKVIETGRDKNTIDMFCKLTDAQIQNIARYSARLAIYPTFLRSPITAPLPNGSLIFYVTQKA